ncbi:hypothetical protein FRB99_003307 [Tulasnella sp. 403]|nr:hypothetical protein FRB99_003307 [Tulasnella sp. 403]
MSILATASPTPSKWDPATLQALSSTNGDATPQPIALMSRKQHNDHINQAALYNTRHLVIDQQCLKRIETRAQRGHGEVWSGELEVHRGLTQRPRTQWHHTGLLSALPASRLRSRQSSQGSKAIHTKISSGSTSMHPPWLETDADPMCPPAPSSEGSAMVLHQSSKRLHLGGHYMEQPCAHLISPWQDSGNVLDFVRQHPDAHRPKLVCMILPPFTEQAIRLTRTHQLTSTVQLKVSPACTGWTLPSSMAISKQ